MDVQLMNNALQRMNTSNQSIEEDASKLLKLRDSGTGEPIVGLKDEAMQITDIFRRLRR
jgi:hypothetical protein